MAGGDSVVMFNWEVPDGVSSLTWWGERILGVDLVS